METKNKRSTFSGQLGYVMAVAGSAVGLGNIWRFPYLAAKYGNRQILPSPTAEPAAAITKPTLLENSLRLSTKFLQTVSIANFFEYFSRLFCPQVPNKFTPLLF